MILDETPPPIEVCEGDNGNAIVDGEDSEVPYLDFITAYEQLSACN